MDGRKDNLRLNDAQIKERDNNSYRDLSVSDVYPDVCRASQEQLVTLDKEYGMILQRLIGRGMLITSRIWSRGRAE